MTTRRGLLGSAGLAGGLLGSGAMMAACTSPYADLRDQFVARVRNALDGTGNYGARSYGMKSYLLPDVGLITPSYDDGRQVYQLEA